MIGRLYLNTDASVKDFWPFFVCYSFQNQGSIILTGLLYGWQQSSGVCPWRWEGPPCLVWLPSVDSDSPLPRICCGLELSSCFNMLADLTSVYCTPIYVISTVDLMQTWQRNILYVSLHWQHNIISHNITSTQPTKVEKEYTHNNNNNSLHIQEIIDGANFNFFSLITWPHILQHE